MPDAGLKVAEIAIALGVGSRTVQNWIADGCPVVRKGRRGHGGSALLDLAQVVAWRDAQGHGDDTAVITAVVLEVGSLLPHLLADAVSRAAREATGPDKARLHGLLAEAWHVATLHVLDALRQRCPNAAHLIRDPLAMPESIYRMVRVSGNRHADGDLSVLK